MSWITAPYCDALGPRYYLSTLRLTPYFQVLATKWSRVSVAFEPRVSARIMLGTSHPVRTPSYNPGFTVYCRLLNDSTHLLSFVGSLFHHSNGQDGPTLDSSGTAPFLMNTKNGSFATNYYTLGFAYGQSFQHQKLTFQTNSRIEIEHHIFGIDEGMKHRFGNVRLNMKFGTIVLGRYIEKIKVGRKKFAALREQQLVELFRFTGTINLILDKFTGPQSGTFGRRINLELAIMYRFPGSPNMSVMLAGGYYGQDPYNIYMYDRYGFVRIGFATGFFVYRLSPDKFKIPNARNDLILK
ncbi:MAG: hypothetical protein IPP77_15405 [Bacteroidetes bacterium]|nr:hypothetical protein [Bacteroidota bacterium]